MSGHRPPAMRGRGRARNRDQYSPSPTLDYQHSKGQGDGQDSPDSWHRYNQTGSEENPVRPIHSPASVRGQGREPTSQEKPRKLERSKNRRPDVQVYVPRARRSQSDLAPGSEGPSPNRPGSSSRPNSQRKVKPERELYIPKSRQDEQRHNRLQPDQDANSNNFLSPFSVQNASQPTLEQDTVIRTSAISTSTEISETLDESQGYKKIKVHDSRTHSYEEDSKLTDSTITPSHLTDFKDESEFKSTCADRGPFAAYDIDKTHSAYKNSAMCCNNSTSNNNWKQAKSSADNVGEDIAHKHCHLIESSTTSTDNAVETHKCILDNTANTCDISKDSANSAGSEERTQVSLTDTLSCENEDEVRNVHHESRPLDSVHYTSDLSVKPGILDTEKSIKENYEHMQTDTDKSANEDIDSEASEKKQGGDLSELYKSRDVSSDLSKTEKKCISLVEECRKEETQLKTNSNTTYNQSSEEIIADQHIKEQEQNLFEEKGSIGDQADNVAESEQLKKRDTSDKPDDWDNNQTDSEARHEHMEPEEPDEDSWDAMFNDDGDCVDPSAIEELTRTVGKVKIKRSKKINYLDFQPKDKGNFDYSEYAHIIEIYDFPKEFVTRDLITAFQSFMSRGFDLKWVDDTHVLGIFSSAVAAQDALDLAHPLVKVCPLSQASKQSREKARWCTEFLQPYKPRPETSAMAARRLVAGALGIATSVSKEKRDRERQQLREAKEKRKKDRQNREDIWEYGKCAMDEES